MSKVSIAVPVMHTPENSGTFFLRLFEQYASKGLVVLGVLRGQAVLPAELRVLLLGVGGHLRRGVGQHGRAA
eukprot:6220825-Alexandrium_andersonii.AAC.1